MALDMDFIGFSFNGRHSSEFNVYLVSNGSRYQDSLVPSPIDYTEQIPGRAGALYFGSDTDTRTFPVSIAYDNLSERQVRQLRQWLSPQATGDLVFDERPYKTYSAKISDAPSLEFICFDNDDGGRVYKGEGTINFISYYPYARVSGEKKELKYYLTQFSNLQDSIGMVTAPAKINDFKEKTKIRIEEIWGNGGDGKINTGGVKLSSLKLTYDNDLTPIIAKLPNTVVLNSIGEVRDIYNLTSKVYVQKIREEKIILKPISVPSNKKVYKAYLGNDEEYVFYGTLNYIPDMMSNIVEFSNPNKSIIPPTDDYFTVSQQTPSIGSPYCYLYFYLDESFTSKEVILYTLYDTPITKAIVPSVGETLHTSPLESTDYYRNTVRLFDPDDKEISAIVGYTTYKILDTQQWADSTDMIYDLGKDAGTDMGYDHIVKVNNTGDPGFKCYNPGDIDTDFILTFDKVKIDGNNLTLVTSDQKTLTWAIYGEEGASVSATEKVIYDAESGQIIINSKERRITYIDDNGVETPIYFTLREGDFFKIPAGAGVNSIWTITLSGGLATNTDFLKSCKIEYDYLYY